MKYEICAPIAYKLVTGSKQLGTKIELVYFFLLKKAHNFICFTILFITVIQIFHIYFRDNYEVTKIMHL